MADVSEVKMNVDPATVLLQMFFEELNGAMAMEGISKAHGARISARTLKGIQSSIDRALKKHEQSKAAEALPCNSEG